jgi:hypothetical protein
MGESSGVPIEPPQQTRLADATMALPGVVACGVPGAGGYDAVYALVLHSPPGDADEDGDEDGGDDDTAEVADSGAASAHDARCRRRDAPGAPPLSARPAVEERWLDLELAAVAARAAVTEAAGGGSIGGAGDAADAAGASCSTGIGGGACALQLHADPSAGIRVEQ